MEMIWQRHSAGDFLLLIPIAFGLRRIVRFRYVRRDCCCVHLWSLVESQIPLLAYMLTFLARKEVWLSYFQVQVRGLVSP